jgi:hypothetical protein
MNSCRNCGTPFDECNESQPVCASCGEDRSAEDTFDHEVDFGSIDELLPRTTPTDSPQIMQCIPTDPRGIRELKELRRICIRCGSEATGGSFLSCSNPRCGERWRVNHCRACSAAVDSRDPETPRCPKCGWLICAACRSCNCPA